jgi:hypothetical protein
LGRTALIDGTSRPQSVEGAAERTADKLLAQLAASNAEIAALRKAENER